MKSWLALSQAEGSQSPQPTQHKHTTGFISQQISKRL